MNRIDLLLMADDRLTPALVMMNNELRKTSGNVKAVDEKLKGLGNAAGAMDGLHGKLTGIGNALMSIGTGAALAGLAAATAAIWGLKGALEAGGRQETRTLMTASDIAKGLAVDFNTAKSEVEGLQASIADMAAVLPGDTGVYTAIFDSLGGSLSRNFKGDAEGFRDTVTDLTKRAGVLAATTPGVDGSMAGSVIDRLISGSSGFQELAVNDIIQKNSNFKIALTDQMKVMGVEAEDWKKQSTKTRLQIVQAALKIATPDELIRQFDNTFESVTQAIQTFWFNPMKGVFGVMRKVSAKNGVTTTLQAFTEMLINIVDLGGAINTVATTKGLKFDPMLALIGFFQNVSQILNGIEYFVRSGGKLPTFRFDFDLVKAIRGVAEGIPGVITGMFGGINNLLSRVDLAEAGTWLGDLTNSVATMLTSLFNSDWVAIGEFLGRLVGSALRGAVNFLATLDYAQLGSMLGGMTLAIVKLAIGLLKGIVLDFAGGVARYINDIWQGITNPIARLGNALGSLVDKLLSFLSRIGAIRMPGAGGASSVVGIPQTAAGVAGALLNPMGSALQVGGGLLMKGAEALGINTGSKPGEAGKPGEPGKLGEARELTKPTADNKMAFNTYSPSVSISAPNANQLGSTTLDALASQYKSFISQMA